jgi:hypothetical protein
VFAPGAWCLTAARGGAGRTLQAIRTGAALGAFDCSNGLCVRLGNRIVACP